MDKLNEKMVVEVYVDGNKVLSRQDGHLKVLIKNMEVIYNGTKVQHNLSKEG